MDSFAEIECFRGKRFYRLDNINQIQFDYIIITIQNRKSSWDIYNMLVNDYGVFYKKVVPFYVYAKKELYKAKLKGCDKDSIQGLIIGNSHAAFGYLESEFHIPVLNLALPATDIYYCYQTLHKCRQYFDDKLKKLSFVIIDMYDYHQFNLDYSLSPYFLNSISHGGIIEERNFKFNKKFHRTFKEEVRDIYLYTEENVMDGLFPDMVYIDDRLEAMNRWKHIEIDVPIISRLAIGNVIRKRYENRIKENIHLLELLINEIRTLNPNVNIIFTLIPRYISMEEVQAPFMVEWKKEFYDIMEKFSNKYNTIFIDYKKKMEISGNHFFYYDVAHLNTIGGRAMTSILKEDLERIGR